MHSAGTQPQLTTAGRIVGTEPVDEAAHSVSTTTSHLDLFQECNVGFILGLYPECHLKIY